MVISVGNGLVYPSSNPDEPACISHSANTHEKGTNATNLPPAKGKNVGQTRFLTLLWQPVSEKENSAVVILVVDSTWLLLLKTSYMSSATTTTTTTKPGGYGISEIEKKVYKVF